MAQGEDDEQGKEAFYQWLASNHLQELHKLLKNNGFEYLTDFDEMSEQEATKLCDDLKIGKAGIKRRLIKAIEHYNNDKKGNNNASNNDSNGNSDEKDAFEYSVKFTHLNGVGTHGPTKLDEYKGKPHFNDIVLVNGIQIWKVPKTGYYYIVACGARGGESEDEGNNKGRFDGGAGAMVGGTVKLNANNKVKILVGQQGQDSIPGDSNNGYGGGGGGGTFVVLIKNDAKDNMQPLFIAAGGNGAYGAIHEDASNGINGQAIYSESRNADNKKFLGYESKGWAARGASYKNDFGTFRSCVYDVKYDWYPYERHYKDYNTYNGKSFINGGLGGSGESDGGFGGGGGGAASGGGGGGYIGALAYSNVKEVAFWRFGALSFNCCDNKAYRIMKSGENYGHGYVEVKYIGVSE